MGRFAHVAALLARTRGCALPADTVHVLSTDFSRWVLAQVATVPSTPISDTSHCCHLLIAAPHDPPLGYADPRVLEGVPRRVRKGPTHPHTSCCFCGYHWLSVAIAV